MYICSIKINRCTLYKNLNYFSYDSRNLGNNLDVANVFFFKFRQAVYFCMNKTLQGIPVSVQLQPSLLCLLQKVCPFLWCLSRVNHLNLCSDLYHFLSVLGLEPKVNHDLLVLVNNKASPHIS